MFSFGVIAENFEVFENDIQSGQTANDIVVAK